MGTKVGFEVSFSQFAVFASALDQPFNDWTDRHVAQGFAWRPGSVSFLCMEEAGWHMAEVALVDHAGAVAGDAVRVIEVPFDVPADGAVEIGSIAQTVSVSLPAGTCLLRCEFLAPADAEGERVNLTFARQDVPRFAVVRADPGLSVKGPLLTQARPAQD